MKRVILLSVFLIALSYKCIAGNSELVESCLPDTSKENTAKTATKDSLRESLFNYEIADSNVTFYGAKSLIKASWRFAQESASLAYRDALEKYNQGKYEEALVLLDSGKVERGILTKSQYENLLILLSQIYLEMNNYNDAMETLVKLRTSNLKLKPTPNLYQEDFYNCFNSIFIHPKITLDFGFEGGIAVFKTKTKAPVDSNIVFGKYNNNGFNGVRCGFQLMPEKNYALSGNIRILQGDFNRVSNFLTSYDTIIVGQTISLQRKDSTFFFREYPKLINIGISLRRYFLNSEQFRFYLSFEGYLSKQYKTEYTLEYTKTRSTGLSTSGDAILSYEKDISYMRNTWRYGINAEVGLLLYVFRRVSFSPILNYQIDLVQYNKPSAQPPELLQKYGFVDNDVWFRQFNFAIQLNYLLKYTSSIR